MAMTDAEFTDAPVVWDWLVMGAVHFVVILKARIALNLLLTMIMRNSGIKI